MSLDKKIERSREIFEDAVEKFEPEGIVTAVSGGNDSAVCYHLAKELGIEMDYILHINTGTGIPQTTEFVREYYGNEPFEFHEESAGDAYEEYVKRKGFLGTGYMAHTIAYHILKAQPLRKFVSKKIRKGRRDVNVLLLSGARASESDNRMKNITGLYSKDPAAKGNIWVSIIHHWTKEDCNRYLESRDITINPVTKKMCRSGECMCGTMQSDEDRIEASLLYPEWGEWLDELEKEVIKEHPWKWGRQQPKWFKELKKGQMGLFGEHEDYAEQFQPMCRDCVTNPNTNEDD